MIDNATPTEEQVLASGDRATEADVYYAYRLILNREPDAPGLANYRRLVSEGIPVKRLVASFLNSNEFCPKFTEESTPTPIDLGDIRS